MVSLPAIPPSWLAALRPDGRLVFSLAGGPVLITARKTPDGGAAGRVEYERAGFMAARHGPGCPPEIPGVAGDTDGDDITTSPYPVVDPTWGWELDAILSVTTPGLSYSTSASPDTGITTTWITHPDGSWARASGLPGQPATVHQAGPRRLWDILDAIRADWLSHGYLPLWGARPRSSQTAPATSAKATGTPPSPRRTPRPPDAVTPMITAWGVARAAQRTCRDR